MVAENGTRKDYVVQVTREEFTCPVCEVCKKCEEKECSPLWMIIAIAEGVIILLGLLFLLFRKKGNKEKKDDNGENHDEELEKDRFKDDDKPNTVVAPENDNPIDEEELMKALH